jgi:hypothetical protein
MRSGAIATETEFQAIFECRGRQHAPDWHPQRHCRAYTGRSRCKRSGDGRRHHRAGERRRAGRGEQQHRFHRRHLMNSRRLTSNMRVPPPLWLSPCLQPRRSRSGPAVVTVVGTKRQFVVTHQFGRDWRHSRHQWMCRSIKNVEIDL